MRPHRFGILAAGSLLVVLAAGTAVAQSFGPGDQVLSVDASAFLGFDIVGGFTNEGYLFAFGGSSLLVYAPLALPDGAEITQICLYARNEDPADVVDLGLQAVKLVSGGLAPGVVDVPGTLLVADFHFGFGTVCTDPISYVFHETADVDNDGTSEIVAHRLWAYVPAGAFGLGGARITWHRQVSAAPATASFGDVPPEHPFFPYVEALRASGVTGGCQTSPPLFCPDAPLTRGQMAAFLAIALGLHWSE